MNCYTTKNPNIRIPIDEAILKGLAADGGLYMPEQIPLLPRSFLSKLSQFSFSEIAYEVSKQFFEEEIPMHILKGLIYEAINFPAPIEKLDDGLYILELFHGPTLAFKDFGARFMSRIMGFFNKDSHKDLIILVATSGDTGGAVASGFFDVPGTKVVILYPKDRVSPLQEKQLTTLGKNIYAFEIKGSFDDCQSLVKQAFTDKDLDAYNLTSANSINLARLIPQAFYYFEAVKHFNQNEKIEFIVPSGNFGNLSAGFIAKRMGLNIDHFVAATNINNCVPKYLNTGEYKEKESVATISNAMDVGAPSNFSRLKILGGSTWNNIKRELSGFSFTDDQTKAALQEVYNKYNYVMDPHTAVGYAAYKKRSSVDSKKIILSTAHPSKFIDVVEDVLSQRVEIPERLNRLNKFRKTNHSKISKSYSDFKENLIRLIV